MSIMVTGIDVLQDSTVVQMVQRRLQRSKRPPVFLDHKSAARYTVVLSLAIRAVKDQVHPAGQASVATEDPAEGEAKQEKHAMRLDD